MTRPDDGLEMWERDGYAEAMYEKADNDRKALKENGEANSAKDAEVRKGKGAVEAFRLLTLALDHLNEPDHVTEECIVSVLDQLHGWSLASASTADGEPWDQYAHRLERRIKEQRDALVALQKIHADCPNRANRKRITHLEAALGRAALRGDRLNEAVRALTKTRAVDPPASGGR